MKLELPEAVKPVWTLLVHIAVGAIAFVGLLIIEIVLAGVIRALAMIPFSPHWLREAAEVVEQALFVVDLFVVGLFLLSEIIKFGRGLWNEHRHG